VRLDCPPQHDRLGVQQGLNLVYKNNGRYGQWQPTMRQIRHCSHLLASEPAEGVQVFEVVKESRR
jgi:hypothetical protein